MVFSLSARPLAFRWRTNGAKLNIFKGISQRSRDAARPVTRLDLPARRTRRRHPRGDHHDEDRKSTRLNSSHVAISYAVFCLKKKNNVVVCCVWFERHRE